MKHSTHLMTLAALLALPMGTALAQTAPFWGYEGTGTSITTRFSGTTPTITDAHYQEIGGTDMGDSQLLRWERLYSSDYVFGRNSPIVRGWDTTEDWDLNWSTPALYPLPSSSRWISIEFNGTSSTWVFKNTANTGPHPNVPFLGNTDVLALIDDSALFWDSDNTFSFYNLGGGLLGNYTWTTFTGGSLDQVTLSSFLLRTQFIGGEELQIAFLTGANTIDYYNLTNGNYIRSADYSGVTTGPLATHSVADIIDGKVAGWTYIGIDGIVPGPVFAGFDAPAQIPEPTTWALLVGGTGLFALARRRRYARRD